MPASAASASRTGPRRTPSSPLGSIKVDLAPTGAQGTHGRAEAHLPVVLPPEGAGSPGDQDGGVVGQPPVEQVGRGRPGRPVVQAAVAPPATGRRAGRPLTSVPPGMPAPPSRSPAATTRG